MKEKQTEDQVDAPPRLLETIARQEVRINESQTAFHSANNDFQVMPPKCDLSVCATGKWMDPIFVLPRPNNTGRQTTVFVKGGSLNPQLHRSYLHAQKELLPALNKGR